MSKDKDNKFKETLDEIVGLKDQLINQIDGIIDRINKDMNNKKAEIESEERVKIKDILDKINNKL